MTIILGITLILVVALASAHLRNRRNGVTGLETL